jgi:hypothetical protein
MDAINASAYAAQINAGVQNLPNLENRMRMEEGCIGQQIKLERYVTAVAVCGLLSNHVNSHVTRNM